MLHTAAASRFAALAGRYQALAACVIASLFLMALHRSYGVTNFHFDAGEYWNLATFENLINVKTGRGYAYPTLLAPLKFLCTLASDPVGMYRAGMSIAYGVLLTTMLPLAFQDAFGGRLSLLRRLLPVFLVSAVFPGLLLYPLSDLPAVLLAFSALKCAMLALHGEGSRKRAVLMLLAAGAFMGAAYNTRTIYLFSVVALGLLILVATSNASGRQPVSRWLGLASFAVGVFTLSLPQLAINMETRGIRSLAVQNVIDDKSLFAAHLVWGMTLQRYETTVNPAAGSAQVYYFDRAGANLFDREARLGNLFSVPHYFEVVARNPLEFLGIYTRHVINGLDVRDGLVYTVKPSPARNRTAFLNFAVLALAAWVVLSVAQRAGDPASPGFRAAPVFWPISLAMLLLPVAAIVPGAIETRFFLPLHLLAYCTIAMHFDRGRLSRHFRLHWPLLLLALLLTAGVFFAVSYTTMANMQYAWPEIYRFGPPG